MADARQLKMAERERRLKEVRESIISQTKKKGFMTPERKKALKNLLRNYATERLKQQHELRAKERLRVITERSGQPKSIENANEDKLITICKEYHNRIYKLNEEKWDLELATGLKEVEIGEIQSSINDQRGKFIKPPLKKVSKYQTQLEKMRQWTFKLAKLDMRGALKPVQKDIKLDEKLPKKENKPEWAAENKGSVKTPTTPKDKSSFNIEDGALSGKVSATKKQSESSSKVNSQVVNEKEKEAEDSEEESEEEESEEEEESDEGEEVVLRMAA